MLPNANPAASGGKMTPEIMMLSMQESTLNYTQGMYEKLDNILTFLKVDDKEDDLRYQKEQNAKIEEGRETKRNAGAGLRGAATAVKDKALEIGKGVSLGGVLSTLLGGALLAAFFAPDKFDKMVGQIKELSSTVLDSNFFKGVAETAWGIIKKNLELDNLFVTAIFGWRAGAIYSAFEYMGEKLVESMGLKVVKGDDTGTGEVQLGQKIENFIAENLPLAFGAAGLFAALFPGKFFRGIGWLVTGVGGFIAKRIGLVFGFGAAKELTEAAAETAAEGLIDKKDKSALDKAARKTKTNIRASIGRLMRVGARALGIVGGLYAAFELITPLIEDYNKKFGTVEGLEKVKTTSEDLFIKLLPKDVDEETKTEFLERIRTSDLTDEDVRKEIIEEFNIDPKKTFTDDPDSGQNFDRLSRQYGQLNKKIKDIKDKEYDGLQKSLESEQNKLFVVNDKLKTAPKAQYDDFRKDKIELEQKIETIKFRMKKTGIPIPPHPVDRDIDLEDPTFLPNLPNNSLIGLGTDDTSLSGGSGNDTLLPTSSSSTPTVGVTPIKPSHANIDLMSAEIKVGSMAAQSSSMQPVVIDSSSSPSFVNNSQTMVNASRTSIYESMRETFSLESAAGRRFSAFT